ncbi:MAG: prolyl oligopeptidase family serine peptidase, partial [Acidobacteriota bacterium]|nr:prolyl oligopeptidase family serine peptidase [Acidobacteriota bacterium]
MKNALALSVYAISAFAAIKPPVKPVPPPGIAVSESDRADLESGLSRLGRGIDELKGNPLLPDVLVYHKAVRYALEGNEFFKADEIAKAKQLLREGQARSDALAKGESPWTSATGLVVRGYVSKIDQSVQPYGLVIPASWSPERPHHWRLDTWFHGRNETLSEVNFIADREKNPGEFTPRDTIVLHLYGRYCNANKLAGEVDLFEALADVKRHYSIDERRIVVRGFSMGGAAAWHIAAHHAGLWAAAAPGAGFAETEEFVPGFDKAEIHAPWYEKTLWHLTNATDYAVNLFQCPTVAYNGEIDQQKQAADIMARYLEKEGMHLTRVVGPNTGHKYHPDSKVEINRIVDLIVEKGSDPYPRKVRFTTWTLTYNRMKWVVVDGLDKHWERARVDAEISGNHTVSARTSNVSAISFEMGPGGCALDETIKPTVILDGQKLTVAGPATDRSWMVHFRKSAGKWDVSDGGADTLAKRHNLQGPIDDAFLDSFVMVRPTGTPMASAAVTSWAAGEQARAIREWRRQFRGDAQVKDDTLITDADIANSNLVLWGDPGSNR